MQRRTKTQLKKLKKAEKDKAKEEKAKAEAIANTKNVFDEDEDGGLEQPVRVEDGEERGRQALGRWEERLREGGGGDDCLAHRAARANL